MSKQRQDEYKCPLEVTMEIIGVGLTLAGRLVHTCQAYRLYLLLNL